MISQCGGQPDGAAHGTKAPAGGNHGADAETACQNRTVNSLPLPTSDFTIKRARCRVRICLTIARPRPVPFFERLSETLTR